MSDRVIRVESLGKRFRIGRHRGPYRTLRESLRDAAVDTVRRAGAVLRGQAAAAGQQDFWALKDVSFEVGRGEVVGVIGRNGAGKSTLLKILSRITEPSEGEARLRGRVGALLEVGTGFHPELTGRDNIYLNGALLGMGRADIRRRFDAIVDFAEMGQFIDTPVKHYSSGMYMRLAFAVAAHLEPEILVVDEVLAVGDVKFQKRCLDKMGAVSRDGRTVLFVSHNMQAVRNLCRRCVLLGGGRVQMDGPPGPVVAEYYKQTADVKLTAGTGVHDPKVRRGSGAVRFTGLDVTGRDGRPRHEFGLGEPVRFDLRYEVLRPVPHLYAAVILKSARTREVATSLRVPISATQLPAGRTGQVVVELPDPPLRPGEYPLYFWLGNDHAEPFDVVDELTNPLFVQTDRGYEELGYDPTSECGVFDVPYTVVAAEGAAR
ncbi:MAG: ABC transporter ATP-binding protein [Gemmataceae bacterium]